MNEVYEIRDVTDYDIFYSTGLFRTLDEAINAVYKHDFNLAVPWDNHSATVKIIKRPFGLDQMDELSEVVKVYELYYDHELEENIIEELCDE